LKHLTADDIQRYLDGTTGPEARALEVHLADCAACRTRLGEYRTLYAGLGEDRGIREIQGLPDKVMGRLPAGRLPERESALPDFILAGCGVLLAAAALVVFVGIGSLAAGLAGLGTAARDFAVGGVEGLRASAIAGAAAVMVLVHLANGIALRRARTRTSRS
jgi:anti-sigma factor RsiW